MRRPWPALGRSATGKKMAFDTVGGEQRDQKLNMPNRQADKEQGKVKVKNRQTWRVVNLCSVLLVSQPSHKYEGKAPHFHIIKFIIIKTVGLLLRIRDWAEVLAAATTKCLSVFGHVGMQTLINRAGWN